MELWDIYDADKKPTGRTMKRNDWCLKNGEYHLTVLGVVARPDGKFLITKRVMTKAPEDGDLFHQYPSQNDTHLRNNYLLPPDSLSCK